MKKLVLLLILLVAVLSPAAAAKGDISAGLALGQPSGITGTYELEDQLSVDGLVAFRFGSNSVYLRAVASYEITEFAIEDLKFYPYAGAGVGFNIGNSFGLDVVAPVGVSYYFDDPPIELFLEVTPGLDLMDLGGTPFSIGGSLGARYRLDF
jgi:hypothetical protein